MADEIEKRIYALPDLVDKVIELEKKVINHGDRFTGIYTQIECLEKENEERGGTISMMIEKQVQLERRLSALEQCDCEPEKGQDIETDPNPTDCFMRIQQSIKQMQIALDDMRENY